MSFRLLCVFLASSCVSAFALNIATAQVAPVRQHRAALFAAEGDAGGSNTEKPAVAEEDKMTIDKVAAFGIAGVLSIAVAESVFWILSFP